MAFPNDESQRLRFATLRKAYRYTSLLLCLALIIATAYPLSVFVKDQRTNYGSPDPVNHPVLPYSPITTGIKIALAVGVIGFVAIVVRTVYQSCRRVEKDERWIRLVRVAWEVAIGMLVGSMLVYWRVRYRRRTHDVEIWAWTCTEPNYARELQLDTGFRAFFEFHWQLYCGMLTTAYVVMCILFLVQVAWVAVCFWLRNPCVRSSLR